MKTLNLTSRPGTLVFLFLFVSKTFSSAQCASSSLLGSASNMIGVINNNSNPVAADKNLNTALFIHRHNAGIFGGNTGNLRYDISTNGGSTWSNNLGVLNPA